MPGQPQTKTAPLVQFEPRSKGERTRERILDLAYDAVIRKGFAATSIEELVEAAGITKSGFFYHFKDKTDLGRQLVDRYLHEHIDFLEGMIGRARELSDDPLHSFLVFLKLYAESTEEMIEAHPGCLLATITFQDLSWDRAIRDRMAGSVRAWRERFLTWLEEIAKTYAPKAKASLEDLADAILAFTYGGMTLAKALDDTRLISRQAMMFRETVRLHFLGA